MSACDEVPGSTSHPDGKGTLYVFSGPSGVGKGTVLSRVLDQRANAWPSVSATTRAPRTGEIDGTSYFFLNRDDFMAKADSGELLEWAEYAGNLYGTPQESVEAHLEAGDDVILEIDVQGAMQIREAMPECVLAFIEPPSIEELARRLQGRGTEDESALAARLKAAEMELARKMEYDIVFTNDDIDDTVEAVCDFMDARAAAVD